VQRVYGVARALTTGIAFLQCLLSLRGKKINNRSTDYSGEVAGKKVDCLVSHAPYCTTGER